MSTSSKDISDRVSDLRNFINDSSLNFSISEGGARGNKDWPLICVFLDAMEDACLALELYETDGLGNTWQEQYCRLYGVLSAAYIQMETLHSLREMIGSPYPKAGHPGSAYAELRSVRNDLAAHPVRDQGNYCAFVTRLSLSRAKIEVTKYYRTEQPREFYKFDLRELLDRYKEELLTLLDIRGDMENYAKTHYQTGP